MFSEDISLQFCFVGSTAKFSGFGEHHIGLSRKRPKMERHRVLIVDVNSLPCTGGGCGGIASLIESSTPKIRLEATTAFPPKCILAAPVLVLLRPSRAAISSGLLSALRNKWSQASILGLFCSGWESSCDALQFLLEGLDDFVSCPFKSIDLIPRVQRLLPCESSSSSRARTIKEEFHLEALVGESECLLRAIEKTLPIARSNATVLISGETGTGKELFARAIHYMSPRRDKPFIPINCGALPDHLFENELFGHIRGAFTDASCAVKGLIAVAEGGTLFLDEIDALSPPAQIKLLRFLQNGEYRPLGSPNTTLSNVRLIAATNANLREKVENKVLREDLYHRLNILRLSLPPLRERIEDIELLSRHFLAKYGGQNRRKCLRLSHSALQKLMAYSWPGNVRELEAVIQRTVVLNASAILHACDIDLPTSCQFNTQTTCCLREAKSRVVEQFERSYLISLLAAHLGNVSQAARAAGKERRDFQRLLRKYHLQQSNSRLAS